MTSFNLTIAKEITGKRLQFESLTDLETWIQLEEQAYQWIQPLRRNFSNILWNHVVAQFTPLKQQIDSVKQNIARAQPFEGNHAAITSWFVDTYSNRKLVLSTSADFKAAIDMKELSAIKAVIFLGHVLGVQNLFQHGIETIEMVEGSFEYSQFAKGTSTKDLSAQKQSLEELKKEWDQHLTEYKTEEDKLKTGFESTKTNFDNYFKDTQKNVSEHLTKHTIDLDELKKTYDQFMALKAPVDYWSQKQREHSNKITQFKNWTLGVGIAGGGLLLLAAHHVFSDNGLDYWKIGFFILITTLFFWSMRVLVKLLLSNIHLEGDANERVVMTKTYLALLRDQSGLNDNDKKLILATLFRPGSAGIVGDDGIPPGIYDIVTKLVSK